MNNFVIMALVATTVTWLVTALGAATVIFFRTPGTGLLNLMISFAAGVMIAASFWSLLKPAVERADLTSTVPSYIVITVGFLSGAGFIWISDKIISFIQNRSLLLPRAKSNHIKRITMLILSITLHNIPEGLAVGVAFGALKDSAHSTESIIGAVTLALGIAIQNFPEGAAVSLPLRREGYSRKKSFILGQASAIVEPFSGIIGAMAVVGIGSVLPNALSFAAGAMILVAVHELIPECQKNRENPSYFSSMGIIGGFAVMTLLDVMLG